MAALAAAETTLWFALSPHGDGAADLTARLAGIEARQRDDAAAVSAQAEKLDELSMRFARLSSQASPAAADPAFADRLAALEAEVKPLAARLDETDRRIRDAAGAAKSAGDHADEVAGELDEIKNAGTDRVVVPQVERPALEAFAARLDAAEAALKSIQQSSAASAAASGVPLRGAMVATALRMAVERGYPFAAELAAARMIGLDPAALAMMEPFAAAGVPRRNALFRDLSGLVPELLRVAAGGPGGPAVQPDHSGNDAGSYLDRLKAGAAKLVRIRPVGQGVEAGQGGHGGDLRGDDPAAVIGRIEGAMTRQDVAGIEAELDKLPAPARELAEPWRKKALAREAAIDAARRLAAASLAGLVGVPAPDVRAR
jgi:hypothetical protein